MNVYLILLAFWFISLPGQSDLKVDDSRQVYLLEDHTGPLSHQIWDTLLNKYVSSSGSVDYQGFKRELPKLSGYLDLLSTNPPKKDWSRAEQLAYWINAYNAFTIKLILDHYPLESIMDLQDPWDTPFIMIGSKKYTLNQIEHDVIRKQFEEPRIHFAVNCASQSCPELINHAYTASKLDTQLERQTRAYINNPKHNEISTGHVKISSLFDWYREDFTHSGTVIDFLNMYTDKSISADAKISYKEYDWSLND